MDRLTTRNNEEVAVYKQSYDCERCGESTWRLPDLGNGSPTEKLARYEDLEEQGKLVVLPCKPGTIVFRIEDDCTYGEDCHTKRMCGTCDYRDLHIELEIMTTAYEIVLHMDQFGKTIFLTEEEANKKLAHMQNKN